MTHIELSKGSLSFDKNVYFRHQLFIFLTKEVTNKPEEPFSVQVNCLVLPSYSDYDETKKLSMPVKLYKLPFDLNFKKCKFYRKLSF